MLDTSIRARQSCRQAATGGEGVPVSYAVKPDHNVVVVLFEGDVSVEENIDVFLRYLADPKFHGRQNVLMDLVDCRFPDSHFADMQRLAYRLMAYYAARDAESRTSIFAPGDVAYGTSRMYVSAAAGKAPYPIEVFRSADEALRFAELDPADAQVRGFLRPF
jgi:hypothetical protein